MAVSTAEISSLFLSVVTAVSALPAVINIPWIALPLCPLSSLMSDTVIATSRIDSYTGDLVSFHYNRHEDDQYVQETIPVMDFIKRLIRHIPEKHFKMIRYGGLYARHRSIDKKLHLAISKEKRHTFRCFNRWRTAILSSFGYDPLICPHCKQQMVILEIYHNHRRVPLEELYEKAMSRSRGKRSSA